MPNVPPCNTFSPSASGLCAVVLCALTLLSPGVVTAATHAVGNCNDSGPGSLRDAVANAISGDTIDLASLGCSAIVLTSGEIEVPQEDLALSGRAAWALTIDGGGTSRVFLHSGTGTLRLRRLAIANGSLVGTSSGWLSGGCVRSAGSVELVGAWVHHCKVSQDFGEESEASGGGIYAENQVRLSYSKVFANTAEAWGGGGYGGGLSAGHKVVLHHSRVYANHASWGGGGLSARSMTAHSSTIHNNRVEDWGGNGGGVFMGGCGGGSDCAFNLYKSTVSANYATNNGGFDAERAGSAEIVDSTVSGNTAGFVGGGWLPKGSRVFNSTIAFNAGIGSCGPGLYGNAQLRLVSSIVAGTTCTTGGAYDLGGPVDAQVTGRDNIVGIWGATVTVPGDTISADPRLAPLADNGGPTRTHLPLADSPALERGSNPLNHLYDQRGSGFPREKGAFPDIGAVER